MGLNDAVVLHIDKYYISMIEIQMWVSYGIDWQFCYTGDYEEITIIPEITDVTNAYWLDIVALGKMICIIKNMKLVPHIIISIQSTRTIHFLI
jgi:hypothetical protein